jgi:hypothetical protein
VQFSLFGAAAVEPSLADLDGLLLAGGHWARNGAGARLSVVVAAYWRAEALAGVFAQIGVAADDAVVAAEGGAAVRTAFSPQLNAGAERWMRGAHEAPPVQLMLTPGGLRLWVIAAGRRDDVGFLLRTAEPDDAMHRAGGAQLARLGLAAVSLTQRAGGPGWRITSARRLRRLAELLGDPPPGAGPDWPG